MKKFKIGDKVQTKYNGKYCIQKGTVLDPETYSESNSSHIADESIYVITEDGSMQVWEESGVEYDTEWIRKQNLDKLL
jgi:hypothetical protein